MKMRLKKRSTKLLLAATALGGTAMTWLMDPANLAAVQQLLHGHARVLGLLASLVAMYNVLHDPKVSSGINPAAQK